MGKWIIQEKHVSKAQLHLFLCTTISCFHSLKTNKQITTTTKHQFCCPATAINLLSISALSKLYNLYSRPLLLPSTQAQQGSFHSPFPFALMVVHSHTLPCMYTAWLCSYGVTFSCLHTCFGRVSWLWAFPLCSQLVCQRDELLLQKPIHLFHASVFSVLLHFLLCYSDYPM